MGLTARRAKFKAYYEQHAACPNCRGIDIETTLCGYAVDLGYPDNNRARCACGWIGVVHDMVHPVRQD